jgi:hypothetical protein
MMNSVHDRATIINCWQLFHAAADGAEITGVSAYFPGAPGLHRK